MILGVDVDGVLNDLHVAWTEWYNLTYCDDVNHEDWNGWGFEDFPGEACSRSEFYSFLAPKVYDEDITTPIEGVDRDLELLRALRHDIVFVTACGQDNRMAAAKLEWLIRHGIFVEGDLYRPASDKSEAPVDILIDDAPHNVETFHGQAILVDQTLNRHFEWPTRIPSLGALCGGVST